jgi:hypothetical protein
LASSIRTAVATENYIRAGGYATIDYHLDVDGHYYWVPHRSLKEQVAGSGTFRCCLAAGGKWIRTPVPRSMQARPKAIIAGFG